MIASVWRLVLPPRQCDRNIIKSASRAEEQAARRRHGESQVTDVTRANAGNNLTDKQTWPTFSVLLTGIRDDPSGPGQTCSRAGGRTVEGEAWRGEGKGGEEGEAGSGRRWLWLGMTAERFLSPFFLSLSLSHLRSFVTSWVAPWVMRTLVKDAIWCYVKWMSFSFNEYSVYYIV